MGSLGEFNKLRRLNRYTVPFAIRALLGDMYDDRYDETSPDLKKMQAQLLEGIVAYKINDVRRSLKEHRFLIYCAFLATKKNIFDTFSVHELNLIVQDIVNFFMDLSKLCANPSQSVAMFTDFVENVPEFYTKRQKCYELNNLFSQMYNETDKDYADPKNMIICMAIRQSFPKQHPLYISKNTWDTKVIHYLDKVLTPKKIDVDPKQFKSKITEVERALRKKFPVDAKISFKDSMLMSVLKSKVDSKLKFVPMSPTAHLENTDRHPSPTHIIPDEENRQRSLFPPEEANNAASIISEENDLEPENVHEIPTTSHQHDDEYISENDGDDDDRDNENSDHDDNNESGSEYCDDENCSGASDDEDDIGQNVNADVVADTTFTELPDSVKMTNKAILSTLTDEEVDALSDRALSDSSSYSAVQPVIDDVQPVIDDNDDDVFKVVVDVSKLRPMVFDEDDDDNVKPFATNAPPTPTYNEKLFPLNDEALESDDVTDMDIYDTNDLGLTHVEPPPTPTPQVHMSPVKVLSELKRKMPKIAYKAVKSQKVVKRPLSPTSSPVQNPTVSRQYSDVSIVEDEPPMKKAKTTTPLDFDIKEVVNNAMQKVAGAIFGQISDKLESLMTAIETIKTSADRAEKLANENRQLFQENVINESTKTDDITKDVADIKQTNETVKNDIIRFKDDIMKSISRIAAPQASLPVDQKSMLMSKNYNRFASKCMGLVLAKLPCADKGADKDEKQTKLELPKPVITADSTPAALFLSLIYDLDLIDAENQVNNITTKDVKTFLLWSPQFAPGSDVVKIENMHAPSTSKQTTKQTNDEELNDEDISALGHAATQYMPDAICRIYNKIVKAVIKKKKITILEMTILRALDQTAALCSGSKKKALHMMQYKGRKSVADLYREKLGLNACCVICNIKRVSFGYYDEAKNAVIAKFCTDCCKNREIRLTKIPPLLPKGFYITKGLLCISHQGVTMSVAKTTSVVNAATKGITNISNAKITIRDLKTQTINKLIETATPATPMHRH